MTSVPVPPPRPLPPAAPPPTPPAAARVPVPPVTWAAMFLRLLAIQGAWNYETLLGNGIGFAVEPALRRLPGGTDGPAYRAALARQSTYFNAHPYMAAVAVGALARAELDGEPPARIERFRLALCGPLGSCGDRLVWAAWLPLCSMLALAVWGLGGGPLAVVATFLGLYNVGHLALRAWGLQVGLTRGLHVAGALGAAWLRRGPQLLGQVALAIAGVALPLALGRATGDGRGDVLLLLLAAVLIGAFLLVRVQGRWEGWRLALPILLLLVLFSVAV